MKKNFFGIKSKRYIYDSYGVTQVRKMKAAGGYSSFDAPVSSFGIGNAKSIVKVKVRQADGEVTNIKRVFEPNKQYLIVRKK